MTAPRCLASSTTWCPGKIRYYGVSVETVDEARRAMVHPNVQSIQIIFNPFRIKPASALFELAESNEVGILARVPLASGLLTGKLTASSTFPRMTIAVQPAWRRVRQGRDVFRRAL